MPKVAEDHPMGGNRTHLRCEEKKQWDLCDRFVVFRHPVNGVLLNFSAEIRSCTKNPMASEAPNPWPPAAGPTNLRGIFGDESVWPQQDQPAPIKTTLEGYLWWLEVAHHPQISGIYGLSGKWCMVQKKAHGTNFPAQLGANKIYTMVSYRNPCCGYIAARKSLGIPGNSWVPSAHPCPVLLLHVLLFPRKGLKGGDPLGVASSHIAILGYLPDWLGKKPSFLMISWDDCRLYMTLPDSWTIPMIFDVSIRSPMSPNFPFPSIWRFPNVVDGLFLPRSPLVLRLNHDVFSKPGYRVRYAPILLSIEPNKSPVVTHLSIETHR